jgi:hypothetical protein
MNGFALFRDFAEGLTKGFVLFLTNRNGYIEEVAIPRLDRQVRL